MVDFEFPQWTKLYNECYTFYLEKDKIIFPNCIIPCTALFNKNPHILSIFENIILFLFTIVLFLRMNTDFGIMYRKFYFLASEHVKTETSLYNNTSSIFIDTFSDKKTEYMENWNQEHKQKTSFCIHNETKVHAT